MTITKHALFTVCCLAALLSPAHAQVPTEIDYQGYLADSAGQPLDGAVTVRFYLYAVETGGSPLWSQTQSVVPDTGLFSTTLGGAADPFPANLFNTPLWLAIQVDSDAEMTPRRALASAPFAQRAVDADSLGGLPAAALDQSGDVAVLQSDVLATQSGIAGNASEIATLQGDVAGAQSDIGALQGDVAGAQTDISTLQGDLAATASDVTDVENTLPTLQPLVSGVCAAGSSIRAVSSVGSVTCETDDEGPWETSGANAILPTGKVGIGTIGPTDSLQVDAPANQDALRVRVGGSTKLRVQSNGSLSIGSTLDGPTDGLYVAGKASIGSASGAASRLFVVDADWQVALDNDQPGGSDWWLGASADDWAASGGKFVVSPTASSSNAALVIDAGKDVGIGVLDPLAPLHIDGGSDVGLGGGGEFISGDTAGLNIAIDNNEIMARNNGGEAPLALNFEGGVVSVNGDDGGTFITRRDRTAGGNVITVEPQIEPSGFEEGFLGTTDRPFYQTYSRSFYAASNLNYFAYSDRRLKTNVQPIEDALSTIEKLDGVTYELERRPGDTGSVPLTAKEQYDRAHQLGFIAQDVEKVLPQLVQTDEDSGLKSVGYMGVIPILVEAVKTQQRQIEEQNARMAQQQDQIDELLQRLASIVPPDAGSKR